MAKSRHAYKKRSHNRMRYSARNPHSYHKRSHNRMRRRRAHNPFNLKGLTGSLMPALIGAGGAVALDVTMAYLPVPASLQTGWLNILTRAVGAIGLGYVAGMVAGKDVGKEVAAGGLIVVAYSGLKQALAPTLGTSIKGLSGLADFGDYRPVVPYSQEAAAMAGGGMGAYMPRMGAYMNPAAFISSPASAGASPVVQRQRQMGAYMRSMSGFGGYDSDSM